MSPWFPGWRSGLRSCFGGSFSGRAGIAGRAVFAGRAMRAGLLFEEKRLILAAARVLQT